MRLAFPLVPHPASAAGPGLADSAEREPVVMTIVTWTRPVWRRVEGRFTETEQRAQVKVHVSVDGVRTACGSDIPEHATVKTKTAEWHLHTNCYNCAYRLWPSYGPPGYIRPANSSDFPIRRA
ncbi:hypothetical protein [Streptosporangium sp. NPDC051022]|uniref:hypothetical protein n=1 Tax=Streptosporangium sp. NPDC051022 TaxID=3155752 RepID=UPI00343EA76B